MIIIDEFRAEEKKLAEVKKPKKFGIIGTKKVMKYFRSNLGDIFAAELECPIYALAKKPVQTFLHFDKSGTVPMDVLELTPSIVGEPELPEKLDDLQEVSYFEYLKYRQSLTEQA